MSLDFSFSTADPMSEQRVESCPCPLPLPLPLPLSLPLPVLLPLTGCAVGFLVVFFGGGAGVERGALGGSGAESGMFVPLPTVVGSCPPLAPTAVPALTSSIATGGEAPPWVYDATPPKNQKWLRTPEGGWGVAQGLGIGPEGGGTGGEGSAGGGRGAQERGGGVVKDLEEDGVGALDPCNGGSPHET